MPMIRVPTRESASLVCTRYPAKKMVSAILAISPGWKVKPATLIHSLDPFSSYPMIGNSGINRSAKPATMAR